MVPVEVWYGKSYCFSYLWDKSEEPGTIANSRDDLKLIVYIVCKIYTAQLTYLCMIIARRDGIYLKNG